MTEDEGNTFEVPDLILDGSRPKGEVAQKTHEITTNANVLIVCRKSLIGCAHDRGLVKLFEESCFASERARDDRGEEEEGSEKRTESKGDKSFALEGDVELRLIRESGGLGQQHEDRNDRVPERDRID